MKRIFLLILTFAFSYMARAQQASFYIVADQDDWQLFMSAKFIGDLYPAGNGGKVIVITLTAGDEGYGSGVISGQSNPYYLSKEKGAIYSSKFVRDISNPSIPPFNNTYPLPSPQTVVVNSKSLVKYLYGDPLGNGTVVTYFLRLPDGGQLGNGFAGTGLKSLKKLKDGIIANITSVDGVNTYTWADLVNTIYAIIAAERGTDTQIWVNKASLNITVPNPNDHSDHFYSSTAAQEAIVSKLWIGINEFVMDNSSTLPPSANRNNNDYEQATASFGLYNWSLIKDRYSSKLNITTRAWLLKESFGQIRAPLGGPVPITLLSFSGSLKGNNVLLEWRTSAEVNSKEFQIERSTDGVNYRKLHTTPAAGFSTTVKNYSYLDIEATDLNYYRLKMVDLDGYTKQSEVVIVKNNGFTHAIASVTNPFKDFINIRFATVPKGKVSFRLIDLNGKLISAGEVYNPLSSIIRFDYNKTLSKGLYMLQVENDGKQYGIKLIKE